MNIGSKTKKIALILNLICNAIFGFIIFQISNIMYRNNRIKIWMNQKEFDGYFFEEIQKIIPFLWMVWGALVVLSIFLLICEFKKATYNIRLNKEESL